MPIIKFRLDGLFYDIVVQLAKDSETSVSLKAKDLLLKRLIKETSKLNIKIYKKIIDKNLRHRFIKG